MFLRQNPNNPVHYNVILVGKTGAGKSASGNTILGRTSFRSKKSSNATTREIQTERVTFEGVTLDVYDTPGFFDPERSHEDIMEKLQPLSQLDPSVPVVFLLVMKTDRFTPEEKQTVEMIEDWVPEELFQNIWILFTRGDELESEDLTIEEFINDTKELSRLLKRFEDRYHVFNNKKHDPDQVRRLTEKLKSRPPNLAPELRRLPRTIPPDPERDPLRIVLLGKPGVGKSAVGNTILREKRFRSELSFASVTAVCERRQAVVEGRNVGVVDTPGLFDTEMSLEDLAVEIGWSVYLSSPGPHAFLLVLPINVRFTEQEEEVIQMLEMIFGDGMRKYTIILFTHGDQLEGEDVKQLIKRNESLSRLLDQCGGRYHLFNNKDLRNREQVSQLLEKIDRMLDQNGGTCYSNEMYEDAERCRLEEEERRKQEEEERKQRDEERKQEELERDKREISVTTRIEMKMEKCCHEIENKVEKEIEELWTQVKNRFMKEKSFSAFLWRSLFQPGTDIDTIEKTIMHELHKMNEDTKKKIMEEVKKKKYCIEMKLIKTQKEIETKISWEMAEERKEREKKIKEEMERVRKERERKVEDEWEEWKRNGNEKIKEEEKKIKRERDENIKELLKEIRDRERLKIKEETKKMEYKKKRLREEMEKKMEKEIENMKKEMDKRIVEEIRNVEISIKGRIDKEIKN